MTQLSIQREQTVDHFHPRRKKNVRLRGCLAGCAVVVLSSILVCACGLMMYVLNPPPPTTILILGSDARPDTGEDTIARTDSIMMLGVNPPKRTVGLLSLPRDVMILSPDFGYLRANTIVRNAELNAAGSGIDAMTRSMEATFDVEIDHYVWIDFGDFVSIINALGGIEIDVPKTIIDDTYPTPDGGTMRVEFQPGVQTMDGETALIYARTRHSDSDHYRASRQQQVVDAVMQKMSSPASIIRAPALWLALQENTRTDMGPGEFIRIVPGILLYGRGSDQINRLVINSEYLVVQGGGVMPNKAKIRPWIERYLE